MKKNKQIRKPEITGGQSRREFLFALTAGGLGALACGGQSSTAPNIISRTDRPRVAIARDEGVIADTGAVDPDRTAALVHDAVCAFTGRTDRADAWKTVFKPNDTVGIKVNCLPGKNLSTHPAVALAVVEGARLAGVPHSRIIIWERRENEMERAGFTVNRNGEGPRCIATDSPGFGYDSLPEESGSIGSCFSSIVSQHCTALVSVPVLKDHDLSGVSIGMKNFFGAIHNPNRYHDNNCSPYIPDVLLHPYIRDKLRLVVCDALIAQCQGGPSFVREHAWNYAGILASADPVALDSTGWRVIEERRKEQGLPPLAEVGRYPVSIETAAGKGLGEADPDGIEIIEA